MLAGKQEPRGMLAGKQELHGRLAGMQEPRDKLAGSWFRMLEQHGMLEHRMSHGGGPQAGSLSRSCCGGKPPGRSASAYDSDSSFLLLRCRRAT
jgi:hypothetical protein